MADRAAKKRRAKKREIHASARDWTYDWAVAMTRRLRDLGCIELRNGPSGGLWDGQIAIDVPVLPHLRRLRAAGMDDEADCLIELCRTPSLVLETREEP